MDYQLLFGALLTNNSARAKTVKQVALPLASLSNQSLSSASTKVKNLLANRYSK